MRRCSVLVAMLLSVWVVAGEKQPSSHISFELPKFHPLDLKSTLKCSSVASASLHQNSRAARPDQLVAEAKAGTDNLELTLIENTLLVRENNIGNQKYKVVGNSKKYLAAVFVHDPDAYNPSPIVKSVVIDKSSGFAVWSISEPTDAMSDMPYAETVYLACQ